MSERNESVERSESERSQDGSIPPAGAEAEASTIEQKGAPGENVPSDSAPVNESAAPSDAEGKGWPADDAPTIISKPSSGGSGSPQRNGSAVTVRGRRLAHFELEEPIGVGGMAAVIRARDTQLDRIVALKILPPESANEPEQIRRFEQEARAAARLDHENIARVYYCGEDQGLHFIAFEYVEGENLRDMIARRGRIPVIEATEYVLQVARGLEHAADRGVVHRDIKPSNIVITSSGLAKLIDMGLARTQGSAVGELTQSGVTLGTFDYISPEQALDPRLADTRSDIYSLGCTFYHMLTGRPPTPEGTAARKLHFHQAERPVDPRYYNPEIPKELLLILGRMLAKDPQRRYQHPRELIADLELVLAQWQGKRHTNKPRETLYRLSGHRHRGRTAFAVAVVALCAIAVVSWLEAQRPNAAPAGRQEADSEQLAIPEKGRGTVSPSGPSGETKPPAALAPAVFHVKTPAQLRQAFQEVEQSGQSALVYLEESDYDLSQLPVLDNAVLSLKAGQVVVEPRGAGTPTLRLDLAAGEVPEANIGLLQLQGGIVTFRQVRVVMRLTTTTEPSALARIGAGQLLFQNCEVVVESSLVPTGGTVLHLTGTDPTRCRIAMQQCVVQSTVPLLTLDGSADVSLEDCGLSTVGACVVVRGTRSASAEASIETGSESAAAEGKVRIIPNLTLRHCTWWLDGGPVVSLAPASALRMSLHQSVLARIRGERATVLVEVQDEPVNTGPELSLHFENCVLHRVEPLVVRHSEGEPGEVLLSALRSWRSNGLSLTETASLAVEAVPWAADDLGSALAQGRYVEAFRLRADAQELRRRDQPNLVLGANKLLGQVIYTSLPSQLVPLGKPRIRELIVDGVGGKPQTFDSLSSALNSAAAEGESRILITLRVNGVLPIRSLLDIVGNRQITIRAAEGFHPELSFHTERVPETNTITSLFRVHDGQLTLEQVGFRLTPLTTGSVRWQAVVNVTGSGSCTLRQCYATFIGEDNEPNLALVAFTDPTGAMTPMPGKPGRPAEPPAVHLENCFLRGRGVGMYVAESRPLRFQAHQLLAVLEAPLVRVETSRTETNMVVTSELACYLERVTVCSTEPVVHLLAVKDQAQPVPVRWQAVNSVFVVQATQEQSLLRIEGPQSDLDIRRGWFSWTGQPDKPNVCSVPGAALVWRPLGQQAMMSALAAERTEWSNFWGTNSEEIRFVRGWRWSGFRAGEKPTWLAEPHEFHIPAGVLPAQLMDVGADLSRLPLYQAPLPPNAPRPE
ncbi:MAG: serine/threonine-protein kinase [Gemmatales bacterium]|nr:serine/threonine protein kinase [Gemmatales bacterium]MDW8176563.1 serine/threonine-protein kinase [Gemmatales bacterium]